MITQSESIKELAAALVGAQAEMQTVVKDAKNPFFKSNYATLEAVTDTIRPVYGKHGLAIVQFPISGDNGAYGLETRIVHKSGEWMSATAFMRPVKDDPQGVGSLLTYLRRYSAQAVAFLSSVDDDGNAASGQKIESAPTKKVEVDKDAHKSALAAIGDQMNTITDKDKKQKVRELVFKGKTAKEINAMPVPALEYALELVADYAEMTPEEFNKFYAGVAVA
jgi:hypothetical protein